MTTTIAAAADALVIAGRRLGSRLLMGSGGYPNQQVMLDSLAAGEPALVTVAIRRISLEAYAESLVDLLGDRYTLLPNTAGCATVRDAVLTAELGREALETNWVKLELIGDRETLYPDVEQLLRATEELVSKGFVVLPYCNDDPVTCRKLADAGAAAVMPLGSPIGTGLGIVNPYAIERIVATMPGAGHPRCRHRHRLRCGAGDGTGLRRRAAQHRRRQGARSRGAWRRRCGSRCARGARRGCAGRIPKRTQAEPSSPQLGLIGG